MKNKPQFLAFDEYGYYDNPIFQIKLEGPIKDDIHHYDFVVVRYAKKYFETCKIILSSETIKYLFSEEEVILLELNGLTVNPLTHLKQENPLT